MPRPSPAPGRWFAYFVRCRDGTLYAGATNDVARRLEAHNRGKGAAYTRSRRPVRLVYVEPAADRSDALRREWALKQLTREEKLERVRAFKRAGRRSRIRRRRPAGKGGPRALGR